MKKLLWAVGVVSLSILNFSGSASAEVKEGQWTMTIVTKMAGMDEEMAAAMEGMSEDEKAMMQQMMGGMNISAGPGGAGISTTIKQCITNDNPVPEASDEEGCTSTHSMDGNTVHFETVCPESTSTGEVTYQEDSMQGLISSKQTEDGEEMEVSIEISGEYVGPCSGE
ncbi:MAG TPA: DUF3617 family protein [Candidatus Omnitrophota bacterium]|nr:DUF3617 family protein [Candidatus Omnitrophota bacterium]